MAIFCKKLKIFLRNLKTHIVAVIIRFQSAFRLNIILHLFIIGCGVVNELTVLGEA